MSLCECTKLSKLRLKVLNKEACWEKLVVKLGSECLHSNNRACNVKIEDITSHLERQSKKKNTALKFFYHSEPRVDEGSSPNNRDSRAL